MQRPNLQNFLRESLRLLLPRRWIADNLWLKIFFLRQAIAGASLYCDGALDKERLFEKSAAVDEFMRAVIAHPDPFFSDGGTQTRGHLTNFYGPARHFQDALVDHLLRYELKSEERYFKLEDLVGTEPHLASRGGMAGRGSIFSDDQRREFSGFFGAEKSAQALPESYLMHFFPAFDPVEFVKSRAPFIIGRGKLFSAWETAKIVALLAGKMRMRNTGNILQKTIVLLKKTVFGAVLGFYLALFLFDLGMIIYGVPKNEYFFSFPNLGRIIETFDTPYARRANKILKRNQEARFADFRSGGGAPPAWNSYRINNDGQVAFELNYDSYKSLRVQDQNGLMLISVDKPGIRDLENSDNHRYRALMELVLVKPWWEKALSRIDEATNHLVGFISYSRISEPRLNKDITAKIQSSPAPLEWIRRVNETCECITVLYYKANSMKWADLDEVPPAMLRAIILREDRRFKNNLFPVPHRGNDNLVIIPQIIKKTLRAVINGAGDLSTRFGIDWLQRTSAYLNSRYKAYFSDERRGGSTISNQVMEMLYTRSITALSDGKTFTERQIRQKEHELPASLTVDWFWTGDDILEAYVNEVYGGHLYSDIRGLKSQAEMYFMKDLRGLNLREQVMLVAAIKKPSRIKEYAMWLKARELISLIEDKTIRKEALIDWEKKNAIYKVDRSNAAEVLSAKEKAGKWIEYRMGGILKLLYEDREITGAQMLEARDRQKVIFNFSPGVSVPENRLANNIKRELDRELGFERSDSGAVVITTIDIDMQRKLQAMVDRESKRIYIGPEFRIEGQPEKVLLEGGARVVLANEGALLKKPAVVNKILADVGGASGAEEEWDWISLANRSLGSSLKPLLDLYFLLMGYNLQDELINTRITYHTYSLEQQRIYHNFIHKFPKRLKEIENIEKYWSWSPKNFKEHTEKWISADEALVRSINSVHAQIQEIVTPEIFAELLNEMMGISERELKHQPYRSLILGGSQGDQRYDKFLQAYSIFPNRGILKRQTHIEAVCLSDRRLLVPDFRRVKSRLLDGFGNERVAAASILLNFALRDAVKKGTMRSMDDIGAGKTGTSNEFRDALATVHFVANGSTYMAGLRLGNRNNFSIGEAADTLAVPVLRRIVKGLFDPSQILMGGDFDDFLISLAARNGEIVVENGQYWLKGRSYRPRRLDVQQIRDEKKREYLALAESKFSENLFEAAAGFYESFLSLETKFDSSDPAFGKMVRCYIEIGNLNRAGQLIERFAVPGKINRITGELEREYGVRIKADEDFYTGDEAYEKRRHSRKRKSGH